MGQETLKRAEGQRKPNQVKQNLHGMNTTLAQSYPQQFLR